MGGDDVREADLRSQHAAVLLHQFMTDAPTDELPERYRTALGAVLAENARMREELAAIQANDGIWRCWHCQRALGVALCTSCVDRVADKARAAAAEPQQPARDTADESAAKPRDWWRTRGACRHCGCDVHQDDPAATVGDGVAHVRCQQRVQEYRAECAARRDGGVE